MQEEINKPVTDTLRSKILARISSVEFKSVGNEKSFNVRLVDSLLMLFKESNEAYHTQQLEKNGEEIKGLKGKYATLLLMSNCVEEEMKTEISQLKSSLSAKSEEVDRIIKDLTFKRDKYIGFDGEEKRQAFKDGLSWAIESIEQLKSK